MCGDRMDESILGAARYNRLWDIWVETGDIEELEHLAIDLWYACSSLAFYEDEINTSSIPVRWLMVMKLHGVINL
jgi:hypothetical protein